MSRFSSLLSQLNASMDKSFLSVSLVRHPLCQTMLRGNLEELTFVAQQYSIFPKVLVDYTKIARSKAVVAGWDTVVQELDDNIAEELGRSTQGISHYDFLADGLAAGLNVPVKATRPSVATQTLLDTMDQIFAQDIVYIMGATYAVEATSIPELTIVRQLIELLLEGALPKSLQYFFDMHLNEWEPEHEEDLRRSLDGYIQEADFAAFSAGFQAVLTAMDIWWLQLSAEALGTVAVLQPA
jgi:Domain of Unknown Function with PDB structure (DUF3865)